MEIERTLIEARKGALSLLKLRTRPLDHHADPIGPESLNPKLS